MRFCGFILFGFLLAAQASFAVVFKVSSIPAYTPVNASLYIVGSFNSWDPADSAYMLQKVGNEYIVKVTQNTFEYKFTQRSFSSVEGSSNGTYIPNKTYTLCLCDTFEIEIFSWEVCHVDFSTMCRVQYKNPKNRCSIVKRVLKTLKKIICCILMGGPGKGNNVII